MRRGPTGDWDLPGGAFVFLAVLLALGFAADALGGATYVDPAGWSLEILEEIDRLEIAEYGFTGGPLERELAQSPGDCYLRGLLRTPNRGLMFWHEFAFVAVLPEEEVEAYRVLFMDDLKDRCRKVYDTAERPVLLTQVCFVRPERDNGERAAPCIVHFPERVEIEKLQALTYRERRTDR